MNGIKDLTPRKPIGVVLSIGRRNESGVPIEKDRFHLLMPVATEGSGNKMRRIHSPAFRAYNAMQPERRQVIYGALVHAQRSDCFEHHLTAQKISGLSPSRLRPACTGDGEMARRWDNESGDYLDIKCPHERCQYRLTTPPACKPFMRLLFRLVWPSGLAEGDWPSMLCKYTSGSWNTAANALGFFDEIESAAKAMNLDNHSLYGYPFSMILTQHTNREKRTRFPVAHFSATEGPESFFINQRTRLESMGGSYVRLEDISSPEQIHEDLREISLPQNL